MRLMTFYDDSQVGSVKPSDAFMVDSVRSTNYGELPFFGLAESSRIADHVALSQGGDITFTYDSTRNVWLQNYGDDGELFDVPYHDDESGMRTHAMGMGDYEWKTVAPVFDGYDDAEVAGDWAELVAGINEAMADNADMVVCEHHYRTVNNGPATA